MASTPPGQGPILVGGTGRSGTSVMGDLLNSHPDIVLPAHENKLIVERGGLRDLVDQLGGHFDIKRRHYAIAEFIRWARKLRSLGFRDRALNDKVRALMKSGMRFHKACETVARENPGADLSIHAIGQFIDLPHYDATVNAFIGQVAGVAHQDGIVDTEGLIRPFFTPSLVDREEVLRACRTFLDAFYALPLERASARRWCDDTPSNWMHLDFLHELFPDMRFIHMIRDPRDVVGSYMKQVWAPSDPRVIVANFKAQFADYLELKAATPAHCVKEIRIEDISQDKTRVLAELSEFLGVENRFNGEVFFNEKVNTGSYADALGADVLQLIETELADWMRLHRYLP